MSDSIIGRDGCVEIILARPWCDHPAGVVVRVDPQRGAQMRADGYDEVAALVTEKPKRGRGGKTAVPEVEPLEAAPQPEIAVPEVSTEPGGGEEF